MGENIYEVAFINYIYIYVLLVCSVESDSWRPAPWTLADQLFCPWDFPREEYRNGLPFPPPGDLSNPGIQPASLMSPALAGGFFTTSTTWEAIYKPYIYYVRMYVCILKMVE